MKRLQWKNAFSLIEMLVVIAIILFLAGIMIVAIRGVKQHAIMATCKSNLKQLHTASIVASVNSDGRLPNARTVEYYNTNGDRRWHRWRTGWVDWVRYTDGHNLNQPWSPAPGYTPWFGGSGVISVTKGSLWDAMGRNPKAYVCPTYNKQTAWTDAGSASPPKSPDNKILCLDRPEIWYKGDNITNLNKMTNLINNIIARSYIMNDQLSDVDIGYIEGSKRLLFADMGHSTNFRPYSSVSIAQYCMTSPISGTVRDPCAWDGSLRGNNLPGRSYSVESVGTLHPCAGGGGANAIFVDGHIETILWNQTTNACRGVW